MNSNIKYLFAPSIFFCLFGIYSSCTNNPKSQDPIKLETLSSNNATPASRVDYDSIVSRGYLTALIDNSSTGLFIYRGQTMGYEYELLKMFADSMGLELKIIIETDLKKSFKSLNKGNGDVLAYNLTVTKERQKQIAFTEYHNLVRQVLVQRKPDNWRAMKLHEIEKLMIRNPVELIGKEILVRYGSSYAERLKNLSEEIGGDIMVKLDSPKVETESIISKVAKGEIPFTVADEDVALVNSTYYPNLDVQTGISLPQQIAWGIRKQSPVLLVKLNNWIKNMKKTPEYYVIYNKYFKNQKVQRQSKSEFSSVTGSRISPYDHLIKDAALYLGWDWKLLAAQTFKESRFDPEAVSWAGAVGLLQVMPSTGKLYGITELNDPFYGIEAGKMHLNWLKNHWGRKIENEDQRINFILASYNVGLGHVLDAMELTKKYQGDSQEWEDVSKYLAGKEKSVYYEDPIVKFGYCRGTEPVEYVEDILNIFNNYKAIYKITENN